jgi:hypothetical protein
MTKYYGKNPMMVGRKIAGEFILVPITHNIGDLARMYTLNSVGSRIWEMLDGKRNSLGEIVSAITAEFEVETPEAEADVREFLTQMEEIGAIVAREEGR